MTELAIDVANFAAHGSDPGAVANSGKFYSKDIAGIIHEFFQASDGTVYQMSPVVAPAGGVPYSALNQALVITGTGHTLANSSATDEPMFPVSRDTFTLAANTTYMIRGLYHTVRTTTNSVQYKIGLSITGATISTYALTVWGVQGPFPFSGGTTLGRAIATSTRCSYSGVTPALASFAYIYGRFVVGASGGPCTPVHQFSALPGDVVAVQPLSFIELTALGPNTLTQQGGWT